MFVTDAYTILFISFITKPTLGLSTGIIVINWVARCFSTFLCALRHIPCRASRSPRPLYYSFFLICFSVCLWVLFSWGCRGRCGHLGCSRQGSIVSSRLLTFSLYSRPGHSLWRPNMPQIYLNYRHKSCWILNLQRSIFGKEKLAMNTVGRVNQQLRHIIESLEQI